MTQTQIWILVAIIVVLAIVLGILIATARTMRASRKRAEEIRRTNEQIAAAREKAAAATSARTAAKARAQNAARPAPQAASTAPSTAQERLPESRASRGVRLRARLASSQSALGKKLFGILTRDHLSQSDWDDLEDSLLLADVGAEASEKLIEGLKKDARITGQRDPKQVREALRARLLDLVDNGHEDRSLVALRPQEKGEAGRKPQVIIMVGVNGSGKTTTAGKLGRLLKAEGKSVLFAAADTFRAAAADQLATWANTSGIPLVRADHDGADPASVAFDAAQKAVKDGTDVLIIDTAGRLQNKKNLMDELGKIRRVVEKTIPVGEVLLVLDATVGRNGVEQARVFSQAIGVTGVVLTKLDGSAKGGVVISVQDELGVPVKLVGLGEGPDDLAVFDPASFVDGLVGDGSSSASGR